MVNCGMRLFTLANDKSFDGYRLLQDGLNFIDPFLGETRRLHLHLESDLKLLFIEEAPLIESFSPEVRNRWEELSIGPIQIVYHCKNDDGVGAFICFY